MSFGDTITAVVQFTQAERSGIQFGDDGSFDEANQTHLDLMSRFLAMVQFFVEKWWPSDERLGRKKQKESRSSVGYRKLRAYQVFKRLLGGERWEEDVESRSASTIQRFIRRRLSTQLDQDDPGKRENARKVTFHESAQEGTTGEFGKQQTEGSTTMRLTTMKHVKALNRQHTGPRFKGGKTVGDAGFMALAASEEAEFAEGFEDEDEDGQEGEEKGQEGDSPTEEQPDCNAGDKKDDEKDASAEDDSAQRKQASVDDGINDPRGTVQ